MRTHVLCVCKRMARNNVQLRAISCACPCMHVLMHVLAMRDACARYASVLHAHFTHEHGHTHAHNTRQCKHARTCMSMRKHPVPAHASVYRAHDMHVSACAQCWQTLVHVCSCASCDQFRACVTSLFVSMHVLPMRDACANDASALHAQTSTHARFTHDCTHTHAHISMCAQLQLLVQSAHACAHNTTTHIYMYARAFTCVRMLCPRMHPSTTCTYAFTYAHYLCCHEHVCACMTCPFALTCMFR